MRHPVVKAFKETMLNENLGRAMARVVGKPGSLRFRLARDTVGVMLINTTSMGLSFAVSVVLARLLGVREFGLYAFAMSVVGLLLVPATFGFPQLLVREIAAYRAKEEWSLIRQLIRFSERTALIASLSLVLLGTGLLWLFAGSVAREKALILSLALVILPFLALAQLKGSALQGFQQIVEGQFVIGALRPIGFLFLIGGVWLLGRELMGAALAVCLQALAAGATLVVGGFLLHRRLITVNPRVPVQAVARVQAVSLVQKESPRWLKSSLLFLLLGLLNLIPQHAGIIMLGMMWGPEEVGLYKVAYQSASLIPFGLMAINIAIGPSLSEFYAKSDKLRLKKIITIATVMSLVLASPVIFLFTFAGAWFLNIAFGRAFALAENSLFYLTISSIMQIVAGPLWYALLMGGRERTVTLITGIASSVCVVASIILILLFGDEGAALAMSIYYGVILMLTFACAGKVIA